MEKLQKEYLNNIEDNYKNWMRNSLAQEVQDWKRREDPDLDIDQCYHTSAPIIIYQMIDEHLQVAATISPELINKVMVLSMTEITNYGDMYQVEIQNYKNTYFNDRRTIHLFTRYMMAIVNNCDRFEELAQDLKERWWKPGYHDNEAVSKFETLIHTFQILRDENILTPKWLMSSNQIDTICLTLGDFFNDYTFLKQKNFERVMSKAQDRFAVEYITSMFQPSLLGFIKGTFSQDESFDRRGSADKIIDEAKKAKDLFNNVAEDIANYDSPFDALALLAEVFQYPDITFEQLYCLLHLRGDLSKSDARIMAQEVLPGGLNNKTSTTLHALNIRKSCQFSLYSQVETLLRLFSGRNCLFRCSTRLKRIKAAKKVIKMNKKNKQSILISDLNDSISELISGATASPDSPTNSPHSARQVNITLEGTGVGECRNPSDPVSQGLRVLDDGDVNYNDSDELPGWEAVLWKGNLYISASAKQIREGSKEAFVRIIEYAEESLGASHVVICIDRHTIGEKEELRSILRCFLFMGFQPLAAGHELLPPNPNWALLMANL
ncbi:EXOC3 [Lepeophtheirus salmonis]|uniref:EXOC3 n=1 Tax=Lepeophtheirus salmonis TaxID=72036 RepID=A0A7R8D518_LEPSM|nr:EXOC3 [Lepeophtheirus salmonis]CAF3030584.1 EXOC3 [Lepeophtheirus salmonis]